MSARSFSSELVSVRVEQSLGNGHAASCRITSLALMFAISAPNTNENDIAAAKRASALKQHTWSMVGEVQEVKKNRWRQTIGCSEEW